MKPDSVTDAASLAPPSEGEQGDGDQRSALRDELRSPGTSGDHTGTTGEAFWTAWAFTMSITLMVIALNVIGRRQQWPREPLAAPLIDELSSAFMLGFAYLIPGGLMAWFRQSRPAWPLFLAALATGFLGFAGLHLAGCAVLREGLYPFVLGRPDEGAPFEDWTYEVGKDALAYVAAMLGFGVILTWRTPVQTKTVETARSTFDIQDGQRLIRTPVDDILAVQSAGNYAEFLLADGRRPLMRGALTSLEARLAPSGFVRTHRSWLVNRSRIVGLRPEGSGDFTVELAGGLEAPLSRRYRQALEALRR